MPQDYSDRPRAVRYVVGCIGAAKAAAGYSAQPGPLRAGATPMPDPQPRRLDAERLAAVGVRTVHLAAVVALGAALLGAPLPAAAAAAATVASGLLLLAMDLRAARVRLVELAGVVVLLKLAAVAWVGFSATGAALALPVFWVLLVASSFSAHLPKGVRHWRPGSTRARPSSAGRPG